MSKIKHYVYQLSSWPRNLQISNILAQLLQCFLLFVLRMVIQDYK